VSPSPTGKRLPRCHWGNVEGGKGYGTGERASGLVSGAEGTRPPPAGPGRGHAAALSSFPLLRGTALHVLRCFFPWLFLNGAYGGKSLSTTKPGRKGCDDIVYYGRKGAEGIFLYRHQDGPEWCPASDCICAFRDTGEMRHWHLVSHGSRWFFPIKSQARSEQIKCSRAVWGVLQETPQREMHMHTSHRCKLCIVNLAGHEHPTPVLLFTSRISVHPRLESGYRTLLCMKNIL
jgi:hypothetical protein